MKKKALFGITMLSVVILLAVSCAEPLPPEIRIKDATEARDIVLSYLRDHHPQNAPAEGITWDEKDITPPDLVGASTRLFTSDVWEVQVSYPVVLPVNTIYTVTVVRIANGSYWKGQLKADGTITETSPFQQMTQETSQKVAEDFVMHSPTFVFDGIEDTLKLTESVTLRCPYCWQFTYEFDSAHAGYGDRTDQMLAEVITHHVAVITIDHMDITRALMDEKWDMLQQKMIDEQLPPPPPSGVPAAPNDSIVTAKVLDIINVGGNIPWEIVIEIQSSEDVPGLNNATKSRVGETITVKTSDDVSTLEKGQIITAHVQLRGDERSRFFEASEIK